MLRYLHMVLSFLLQSLKEGADEIDNGLQYHLGRYAFLFESLLHTDGNTLAPLESDASMYIFRHHQGRILMIRFCCSTWIAVSHRSDRQPSRL